MNEGLRLSVGRDRPANTTYEWMCVSRRFFIARQHAMHVERDIVLPILSVCLPVQGRYCI